LSKFPRLFGVRCLNPIHGVLQVLELEHARALSPDGEHWEIQTALAQALNHLPFPLADRLELWLLDADAQAVALIASARNAEAAAAHSVPAWAATGLSEHDFESGSLSRRGIPTHDGQNPRRHAYELEQQVKRRVGTPSRHAWYLRGDDGERCALDPEPVHDRVTFPELPLTRDWTEATESELANDYLDWCAPYLLTLTDIGDAARGRLELAAARRAPELAAQYRLYPRIINQGLIDTARVEARLRSGFSSEGHLHTRKHAPLRNSGSNKRVLSGSGCDRCVWSMLG